METIRAWGTKLVTVLSHLWFIGSLFRVGCKTYAGAFYEFTYLFLWSILPFVLGALALYVASDDPGKSFYIFGLSTFRNGELLVFTISMLAPILYLVLHDPEQAQAFPHKLPLSTAVTLIAITCAALFALLKAHAVRDSEFVFQFSVVLTLFALLFRYLAIVYHRTRLPDISDEDLRSSQNGFVKGYGKHIGESEIQTQAQQAGDFSKDYGQHLKSQ